jgi:hypothetical protein
MLDKYKPPKKNKDFEFSKETRDLFDLGGYSKDWETGMNDADCLHHIMKRVSKSPYNAAPLNNFNTHQPEGRVERCLPAIHSFETTSRFLRQTKTYLDKIGYVPNQDDLDFMEKYKMYYS